MSRKTLVQPDCRTSNDSAQGLNRKPSARRRATYKLQTLAELSNSLNQPQSQSIALSLVDCQGMRGGLDNGNGGRTAMQSRITFRYKAPDQALAARKRRNRNTETLGQ